MAVESDGVVFGFTTLNRRSYKSMNYHRQGKFKRGKTLWASEVGVAEEPMFFESSDANGWSCAADNYWWISANGVRAIGALGERIAFFPRCGNHPGPWHGYPVAPSNDENYEVPEEIIAMWEAGEKPWVDNLIAGRIRKGKI